jgi:uncharacterized protein YidB (DUF937 family)
MSFFEDLLKQRGGAAGLSELAAFAAKNPQVLAAAISLLSSESGSVGGPGGLGSLINAFQKGGLDDVMSSWISTGENKTVTPDQITSALGHDTLSQFASKAGVDVSQAAPLLAAVLPMLINHVTPDAKVPASQGLEDLLGSFLGGR